MERIWGPVEGFYLAAYAAPTGDGDRFCSYAKVCWARPESYWDADCAFKIFGGEHHRSIEGALGAIELEAGNELSLLPLHARALVERRRRARRPTPPPIMSALFRHRFA